MPNGDSSWHINSYDDKENFGHFFINEYIPAVEMSVGLIRKSGPGVIAGLLRGGYDTWFMRANPQLFAAAAPLSAAVFCDDAFINMSGQNYENTSAIIWTWIENERAA